jgi:hypothetical protein
MTTIHLQVAPRVGPAQPRGARIAAAIFLALGRRLAQPRRSTTPTAKSAVEEARDVRELALQYQLTDPRVAAELLAAADRHERLHGVG